MKIPENSKEYEPLEDQKGKLYLEYAWTPLETHTC